MNSPASTKANEPTASASPPWWKRAVSMTIAGLFMSLPGIILLFTPYAAGVAATMPGIVAGSLGVVFGGVRGGLQTVAYAVVVMGLAPLCHSIPIAGLIFAGALAACAAYASTTGMTIAVKVVSVMAILTIFNPDALTMNEVKRGVTPSIGYVLGLAAIVGVAGSFAVLVNWITTRNWPPRVLSGISRERAIVYGSTLAILTGIPVLVGLIWLPDSLIGWIPLTVYMVVRPMYPGTSHVHGALLRIRDRSAGTLGGAVIISALTWIITDANLLVLIGLIFMQAAMVICTGPHKYWVFVMILTPAMVFFDSSGVHVGDVLIERITFTLIGILLALASLWLNSRFTFDWVTRAESEGPTSTSASPA